MWGIPSLALDICSLCQFLEEKPKLKPNKIAKQRQHRLKLDTDTIVIGNGPAGIALSALLSGWQPYYNTSNPHPDPFLHERLLNMAADGESLFSKDLSSLADAYFAHCANSANPSQIPFAALYDALVRPQRPSADLSRPASCLCWRRNNAAAVPHIVLGDQHIGGSWNGYDDEMVTVSVSEWMDLPGYSLASDFMGEPELAQVRPVAGLYKMYLLAYALAMGLEQNFCPLTKVTQIEKFCHPLTGEMYWEVSGIESEQRHFVLRCRNIVLACGQQQSKMLGIPGELPTNHVVYDLSSLKQRLEDRREEAEVSADCPVIVVGDGISAADAVLHCLSTEQPVLHVIRRTERELRNIQLSRLSHSVYPEYSRVFQLLSGRTREVNYRRMLGTSVRAIESDSGVAVLETPRGMQREPFRIMAVCIGRRSELPLLREYLNQNDGFSYEFTTNYQSVMDSSLFAVGAVAGEHFVRYLIGGTLCVAQTLLRNYRNKDQTIPASARILRKRSVEERSGDCAIVRTTSAAGSLVALLKTSALATTPPSKAKGINRAKSQLQFATAAVT